MATDRQTSLASTSREDNALFLDILHEAPLFGHRKSRSIFGSGGYAALAIGAPWIFHPIQRYTAQLLCSCAVVLLAVTGIFQQYLVFQVQKIRLQGYYSFSQKLKHIVRLPFATIAYGTAAMLLVMVWRPHTGILSISTILRYYNAGRLSDQQMALLQYQRENLHFLSEEILRLQECLSKYERSDDGTTPQVDLAHLLAARDQELRTLSAEVGTGILDAYAIK
ncbi:TMEM192 family [Parasponia andersonii]|uniref:TMEM192 family n=1 Tax=Parasponia andersonii TaxID=3476 RepID=A0A2P5AXT2_PARAD|nr:TMEM192 family [Parasponia andersonii]